jgi:ribose transport system substrate-binding protein
VKRLFGTIAVVAAVLASASCGSDSDGGGGDAGGGTPEKVRIGFSQANNGDVWRINQTNKVKEHCAALIPGAEVFVTDGAGKGDKQSADVDDLISKKVNVLLLTPLTAEALTPAADRATAQKIPVITLDRAVTSDVTQHIGADNKLIGAKAAEYVANTLLGGKGGKIIEIQGVLGASATTDRHNEFKAWLDKNAPNVKIIESQTGEYRREPAVKFMEDMLQRYKPGDFDVVYAHNDEMALGAVQALKAANRLNSAKVVGIDGQNEAIDSIKKGEIAATFTYDNAGKEACESAAKLLKGETLQKTWVLQTNQIDSTNVDQWVGKGF